MHCVFIGQEYRNSFDSLICPLLPKFYIFILSDYCQPLPLYLFFKLLPNPILPLGKLILLLAIKHTLLEVLFILLHFIIKSFKIIHCLFLLIKFLLQFVQLLLGITEWVGEKGKTTVTWGQQFHRASVQMKGLLENGRHYIYY